MLAYLKKMLKTKKKYIKIANNFSQKYLGREENHCVKNNIIPALHAGENGNTEHKKCLKFKEKEIYND